VPVHVTHTRCEIIIELIFTSRVQSYTRSSRKFNDRKCSLGSHATCSCHSCCFQLFALLTLVTSSGQRLCNGTASVCPTQWRNDGVAAASSDGAPLVVGAPTVLEFLVINFSGCSVLLSNCYII